VALGIGTAYFGALWVLPMLGVSINMLSMFAFLLILGIIVDDAIIVGESIYATQQSGLEGKKSAIFGAEGVYKPVLFAVLSTMIVFYRCYFCPATPPNFCGRYPLW
jgi:multidrug efflux pump subunit AcrB